MSLYNKYRPSTFDEIFGNKAVVSSIKANIHSKDPAHSILLCGPSGCGKTTIGRIIAGEFLHLGDCAVPGDSEFNEIDSADFRGIDTIRDIRQKSAFFPMFNKNRVWLLDECHKLTNDAQSALLKILEDTPKHTFFILATTEPKKIITTVRSRCLILEVNPLSKKEMCELLNEIINKERIELDDTTLSTVIENGKGVPRDTIQLLDMIRNVSKEEQMVLAEINVETNAQVIDLCRALINKKPWKSISALLKELTTQEPETIRRTVLSYCTSVLLNSNSNVNVQLRAAGILDIMAKPFYDIGFPGLVLACFSIVN